MEKEKSKIPERCETCLGRKYNECDRDPVEQSLCLSGPKEINEEMSKHKKHDAG